uniref:Uncharacterized protein n=1 Tax=Lygus hesperus TaxID=30085 RepID=A0A0A9XKV7_LYGHE
MDDTRGALSQEGFFTIPLSPIPESGDPNVTEMMPNQHSGSIFDPPEEIETHQEQHDSEPLLPSDPIQSSSNLSHFESEGVLTRSKSGTIKRTFIAPEDNSTTVEHKKKRKIKRAPKTSQGTQVMPRMLAPIRKRAPKKNDPEDPELKENMPPKAPKKQHRASKADEEIIKIMCHLQLRKNICSREADVSHLSGVKRRLSASSPLNTSTNTDVDNAASSESSNHGVQRRLSSSSPLNTSTVTDVGNAAPSQSSIHDCSVVLSSSHYQADSSSMYGIQSLAEDEGIRGEPDERECVPRSLDETILSSRSTAPNKVLSTNGPNYKSEKDNRPMAVILQSEMFKEGSTVEIKLHHGEVTVSSKQDHAASKKKKSGKEKINGGRKRRGGRRSRKDSWTSSESDSSSSCSSCDTCSSDSCSSTCDDSSTSSSSSEGDYVCRRRGR